MAYEDNSLEPVRYIWDTEMGHHRAENIIFELEVILFHPKLIEAEWRIYVSVI